MKTHYKALGDHGTLGIQITLCILFGAWGGHWLDEKFHTAPVLLVIGFCFGLGAAGKSVHESWKQMQKEAQREEREQGNPAPLWEKREEKRKDEEKKPDGDGVDSSKDDHGEE
jgi:F0F1-type ATP synthase assembly protein I